MLCCDSEEAIRDRQITQELKLERRTRAMQQEIRLLVLGAAESGKSTLLKQMKILYKDGYTEEERRSVIPAIHCFVLFSFKDMLSGAQRLKIKLPDEMQVIANNICSLPTHHTITLEIAEQLKLLLHVAELSALFKRMTELQIHTHFEYMAQKLDEIVCSSYIPTVEDILRTRLRTAGINSINYELNSTRFSIFHMGGRQSSRRKWMTYFQHVTAVIYIIALNEYDLCLREDPTINRMHEALDLFKTGINNEFLKDTAIILLLNKTDLFRDKITRADLRGCFPDYSGELKFEPAAQFIGGKFKSFDMARHRSIFVHTTCLIDTDQVARLFEDTRITILQRVCRNIGLI